MYQMSGFLLDVGKMVQVIPYNLPCKECGGACCKWNYTVYLEEAEAHWVRENNSEYLDSGNGYNALKFIDGACPYLKNGRCSIHEHRFRICREFNCLKLYDKFIADKQKYKWAFWFFQQNPVVARFVSEYTDASLIVA